MPFRSKVTLESWLEEFRTLGLPIAGGIRVIGQDGDEGANTGLVAVRLLNASTETYIEPVVQGDIRWVVTMEPREDAVVLDAAGVQSLSEELATVSALCAFLQRKSIDFVGPDSNQQ